MLKNEKGITLIEILTAMAILSIIFITVAQFFPQVGQMNHRNDVKTKGINIAKTELVEWTRSPVLINYLKEATNPIPGGFKGISDGHYTFQKVRDGLDVLVKIKVKPDLAPEPSEAHYIQIEVKDQKGKQVSKTYGYVLVERE